RLLPMLAPMNLLFSGTAPCEPNEASAVSEVPTMNAFPASDLAYVIRLEEILWGALLLAITIAVHGIGMLTTLRVSSALKARVGKARLPGAGLAIIVLAAWIIVVFNLIEVGILSRFFTLKGAQPNIFSAFYNALLNYTTLQAGYLPVRWRLLEGMLGMAGLITFAWSTGILVSLAHDLMHQTSEADRAAQSRSAVPGPVDSRNQ